MSPQEHREHVMTGPKSTIVTNKRGQVLRWDDFFLNGPHATDDFFAERDQPDET
jgi:hypothetical protein